MEPSTIFLLAISALLGVAVGSLLQGGLNRRKRLPPAQTSSDQPPENDLVSQGDVPILRAWRTLAGRIWLEMDDTRLNDREMLSPEQHRRLVNFLIDLRPWLDKGAGGKEPPINRDNQATVSVSPAREETPLQPGISSSSVSMLVQIEALLQVKLAASPYQDREIHLLEGAGGQVFVMVDQNRFEGIEAVPEAGIRELIRQAVADWENLPH